MIDIEYNPLNGRGQQVVEIGIWLDNNMPNPPLPDPQRWSIGYSQDGRIGVRFADKRDATLFLLKWS
jgi:hypothetical protein